jgi:S1-C subfamily serine protease
MKLLTLTAAVICIVNLCMYRTVAAAAQQSGTAQQHPLATLIPKLPSKPAPAPPGRPVWRAPQPNLPDHLPDFNQAIGTLGASSSERIQWRLATVILRTELGWGSGALISPHGWIISNYHVVEPAAQESALTGKPAIVDVIFAHVVDGRLKRHDESLKATLYRADPQVDLALLKLDSLQPGLTAVPFIKMGIEPADGDECFVIGSQRNGPAWWLRSGIISQEFDYPSDLSQFAAEAASSAESRVDRLRARIIVSDARISPGDSGGPLLNTRGELIGITSMSAPNWTKGSVGWHIALPHVSDFLMSMPAAPEGVPLDVWTAGLYNAQMLEPVLADGDGDGRIDSLLCYYLATDVDGTAACILFMDLEQRELELKDPQALVPAGLWGSEKQGRFKFDLFVLVRADGLKAMGQAGPDGIVSEIRLAMDGSDMASLIWRRNSQGIWSAAKPAAPVPLLDESRLDLPSRLRLAAIADQLLMAAQ